MKSKEYLDTVEISDSKGISLINNNSNYNSPSKPIIHLIDSIKISDYKQQQNAKEDECNTYYVEEASEDEDEDA